MKIKNPDGSVPLTYLLNNKKLIKQVHHLLNLQTTNIANLNTEGLQKNRKELLEVYKKIIIGSSVESKVIEEANKKYYNMSRDRNRRNPPEKITFGRRFIDESKNKHIDETMYNNLKSSAFGREDNIVRCELNREEEFEDVEIQKLAVWSNMIAHYIEDDSIRFMTDLGYLGSKWNKKNITEEDLKDQEKDERAFISNLRKAYSLFTGENGYKFAIDKAYILLSQEDFDVNTTTDQNIINLKNLMKKSNFQRSTSDKNAMKSFLYCLRDQRNKDHFFRLKENFSKELLLNLKELDDDRVLGSYYVEDYAVKDNKGRDTIRMVFYNQGEGNRLLEENDCVYMTKNWKESLKIEHADDIIHQSKEKKITEDEALENIIDKKYSGKNMTTSEIFSTCSILSASIYHLPKIEMLDFCKKAGINLRKGKNLTEESIAYSGNESVDVGFGSKRNDIPFEQLPRYRAINSEVEPIENRCTQLVQRKKSKSSKIKGE